MLSWLFFRAKGLHLQLHVRHYLEFSITPSIQDEDCLFSTHSDGNTCSLSDPIFTMLSRSSFLHRCSRQRSVSRAHPRSSSSYDVPFISPKLTHSYYYNSMSVPLLNHSIGRHLDILAESHANHQCYVFKGEGNKKYTYQSFVEEVNAVATSLIDLGFEKGDRLGVWLPNTSESCVLTYAASKVGVIKVIDLHFFSDPSRSMCLSGEHQSRLHGPGIDLFFEQSRMQRLSVATERQGDRLHQDSEQLDS